MNEIIFVKVRFIGNNKYIIEDEHGENILDEGEFFDTYEEAVNLAEQIRYFNIDGSVNFDEDKLPKGMFWEWWKDLCDISSVGLPVGMSLLANGYFYDKIFNLHENETLVEYVDDVRKMIMDRGYE